MRDFTGPFQRFPVVTDRIVGLSLSVDRGLYQTIRLAGTSQWKLYFQDFWTSKLPVQWMSECQFSCGRMWWWTTVSCLDFQIDFTIIRTSFCFTWVWTVRMWALLLPHQAGSSIVRTKPWQKTGFGTFAPYQVSSKDSVFVSSCSCSAELNPKGPAASG